MGPLRKSKSLNKRLLNLNELSADKDAKSPSRSKQRKQKLSDKLGSQWSREELRRFYEANRKYGQDWKKVASAVPNRTIEMVEALYNMNKAYLSLPEGTASVLGLMAMMTDHYNVLEGGDSELGSHDASSSQKPLKLKRGRDQLEVSRDGFFGASTIPSSDHCLSLLKRTFLDGGQPRVVGKRTPRIPVSSPCRKDDLGHYNSPNKKRQKSESDVNDDYSVHVAALALAEASQRLVSPKVFKSGYERSVQVGCSTGQGFARMSREPLAKLCRASISEEYSEDNKGGIEAESGDHPQHSSSFMDKECDDTVRGHCKSKFYGDKKRVGDFGNNQFDYGAEPGSGNEGLDAGSPEDRNGIPVSNIKLEQPSPQRQRKKNKKLSFEDKSTLLNALQTLADLSLMLPACTGEVDSSIKLMENATLRRMVNNSNIPEATSTSDSRDAVNPSGTNKRVGKAISGAEAATSKRPKVGKELSINSVSNIEEQNQYSAKEKKRSFKSSSLKVQHEQRKTVNEEKYSGQISSLSRLGISEKSSDGSLTSDPKAVGSDLGVSKLKIPPENLVSLPIKQGSNRRKIDLRRVLNQNKIKSSDSQLKNPPNKSRTSAHDRVICPKENLLCSLSSPLVRKWCTFEWFYSAIDYPWFSKREFVEYLEHVGLEDIPALTRVEWGVIRSSLGKPRRFSERFLIEERQKLEHYRQSVRMHYHELLHGIREGLPTDLARPLNVGQRVIALHPKTREVYEGSVLTVDHDKCRVQFDRSEIGVELVKDIDCMPVNPEDNIPEDLRGRNLAVKELSQSKEPEINGQANFGYPGRSGTNHVNTCIEQNKTAAGNVFCSQQASFLQRCTVGHNKAEQTGGKVRSEPIFSLQKELTSTVIYMGRQTPHRDSVPWMKPLSSQGVFGCRPNSCDCSQESGSSVLEIVQGSRVKALMMVNAAIKAMTTREDVFTEVGKALDSIDAQRSSATKVVLIKSQENINDLINQTRTSPHSAELQETSETSVPEFAQNPEKSNAQIPSELVASCVATLLMIQICTERPYPPADVGRILEYAISSLKPCCPQNLPFYREIQMCMERIKLQILARIRTSN